MLGGMTAVTLLQVLVSSLLIPAVTVLFGETAWWPVGRARAPAIAPQPSR